MIQRASFPRERMELWGIGEKLGWPRLPYGPHKALRAGEASWEGFVRTAHKTRLMPALRLAKVRLMALGLDAEALTELHQVEEEVESPEEAKKRKLRENMAKARAARAAKRAAAV